MSIPKDLLNENPEIGERSIITAYRGSIAHGMYMPPKDPNSIDDKDVMSVCVMPIDYYFGLSEFGSKGTKEIKRYEWDIVVYEARKFIRLLAQGNPNVLMLLWLADNYYISRTPAGNLLIDNRNLFVGKHVYHSFTGYAYSQLHKMTALAFEGHMGAKRKALVEKYGFDCKNAAHLIRLLRMGIEFLNDGQLYVLREDAKQLLEIKRGEWTLEQVKDEARRLFSVAEQAYLNSKLPATVDNTAINRLCVDVVSLALNK